MQDVHQLRSHDIEHSSSVDLLLTEEHFEPTDPKESEMSFPVASPTEEITIEEIELEIENEVKDEVDPDPVASILQELAGARW